MRMGITKSISVCVALALAVLGAGARLSLAQGGSSGSSERKVMSRVTPACPELARRMHIQGAVKLEVVVKPNGTVKSTRVIGGNPVLVQAASDAVTKWKFEAGPNETTELVQLTFVAQ